MVEVSDFQCPYCREWHAATYPTIVREYVKTGKVRLAYINFPLSGHKNAWPAAEAAMCVSAQGKFWAMHDALFATQPRWEGSSTPGTLFDSLAASVGADTAAYHKCVSSHALRPLIQADAERAEESGVNSTPSFLIGGHMIAGAQPTEVFRQALDQALKTAAK
jgi:protein-disulfide isomerase